MESESLLEAWPAWPKYSQVELNAITEVLKSNQLFASTQVKFLEDEFAEYLGIPHVVGMGNATQALHLALAAANVGEGDEVIVTNCSWISTASCILMQNAVPVFVDIEPVTLGPDPIKVEEAITPLTKAIITVHILGYPSRIEELRRIADKHGLLLIEDASHAPGANLNGKNLGTFGDISVFSFHQRKAISTGDGGVACTSSSALADKMRRLRSFGDKELSYNYRMTEFAAALGRIGLKKLDLENEKRVWAANYLHNYLNDEEWIRVRLVEPNSYGVYYAIALEINLQDDVSDILLKRMLGRKVPMRSVFPPLNKHPHFSDLLPARGLPWKNANYKGKMNSVIYQNLHLPMSYEYCQGRILELYAHPGVTPQQLEAFSEVMKKDYLELSVGKTRKEWN